jgi:hypothetical protein
MTDELAVGDFVFRQRKLKKKEALSRPYDAVIAGLSWETRGPTALAGLKTIGAPLTLFKFQSRSDETEAAKIAQLEIFRSLQYEIKIKELYSSIDTEKNFADIKSWLQDMYANLQRPLSILIDITCIPKTYVLYIIGLGFSEELTARIDCLYTPGKYDLVSNEAVSPPTLTGPRSLLSEGEWHSRQIPYLEASEYIANDADLLVALGGELGLSLPFIERFEPRRLGLICIEETSPNRDAPMLGSERMAYEELLREPNALQEDIGLCDAVGVARHAVSFVGSSVARGTTMMAIGSKPHAVGMALAALANQRVEVVCRTPASYKAVDVQPSAEPLLYEIEDRFDPASYIVTR